MIQAKELWDLNEVSFLKKHNYWSRNKDKINKKRRKPKVTLFGQSDPETGKKHLSLSVSKSKRSDSKMKLAAKSVGPSSQSQTNHILRASPSQI